MRHLSHPITGMNRTARRSPLGSGRLCSVTGGLTPSPLRFGWEKQARFLTAFPYWNYFTTKRVVVNKKPLWYHLFFLAWAQVLLYDIYVGRNAYESRSLR